MLLRLLCLVCSASLLGGADAVTVVAYKNHEYRILDGTAPTVNSRYECQDEYMALPAGGWAVAPDDADTAAVTGAYHWGTSCLNINGGSARTRSVSNAGTQCDGSYHNDIDHSGDLYKPGGCYRRILVHRPCAAGSFHGASMTTYTEAATAACTPCAAGLYSASGAAAAGVPGCLHV